MSRFGNVRETKANANPAQARFAPDTSNANTSPSRAGKKAMTGYFSPELSMAFKITAMRHGLTVEAAMGEALNDWLRKMGESPVGV